VDYDPLRCYGMSLQSFPRHNVSPPGCPLPKSEERASETHIPASRILFRKDIAFYRTISRKRVMLGLIRQFGPIR
jgi:hypothetical protein